MNRLSNNSKYITKALVWLFYGLIIIFIILYLKNIDFNEIDLTMIHWLPLVIAITLGVMSRYWNAAIWMSLLHSLGAKNIIINLRELFYVYAKSWMGRYIPGKLPWILGKIYFASKLGISKNKLAVSSLLEAALQILVFTTISFILLSSNSHLAEIGARYVPLLLISVIICVICIIPPVFNTMMSLAYQIVKHKKLQDEDKASIKTIAIGTVMFTFSSFVNGITLFLIAKSVDGALVIDDMFFIMAAGNLATAIGMLAIFAPGGIGVREGIQLFLLSVIVKPELAIIIVVLSRLMELVCDFIFWASAKIFKAPAASNNP